MLRYLFVYIVSLALNQHNCNNISVKCAAPYAASQKNAFAIVVFLYEIWYLKKR